MVGMFRSWRSIMPNFKIDFRQWGIYPKVNTIYFGRTKCCWHFTFHQRPLAPSKTSGWEGQGGGGGWGEAGSGAWEEGMVQFVALACNCFRPTVIPTAKCFQQSKMTTRRNNNHKKSPSLLCVARWCPSSISTPLLREVRGASRCQKNRPPASFLKLRLFCVTSNLSRNVHALSPIKMWTKIGP